MKAFFRSFLMVVGVFALSLHAQNSAFTYQGRLAANAALANGSFDFQFTLFDSVAGGNTVGDSITMTSVDVNGGVFTVMLDFGSIAFDGGGRWLEIGVRASGDSNGYTILSPRQAVASVPYAMRAMTASTATTAAGLSGTVSASQVSGPISPSQIGAGTIASAVTFANLGNVFKGTFAGNAGGLTNVNTSSLTGQGVMAWGRNDNGQTDIPVTAQSAVAAIAAGYEFTLAVRNDGTLVAWGRNDHGQTTVPMEAQTGVQAAAAGDYHSLALKKDGSVIAWGGNEFGQATVPAGAQSGVKAIAAGQTHSIALKNDGTVVTWGRDLYGQVTIPEAAQSGVTSIAAAYYHTLAVRNDGGVVAWGYNGHGQTTVPAEAQSGVVAVAGGGHHSLALKGDGSVVAWGWNMYGQAAVPVEAQSGVVAISAGNDFSLALKSDGTLIAWGRNEYGQRITPASAQGRVVAISAGLWHTVALTSRPALPALLDSSNQTFTGVNVFMDKVGIGTGNPNEALHVVGNILASGTVTGASDRNIKENFSMVDSQQILSKVSTMPIMRWNYIGERTPHMGPVAQDFHGAFNVGMDDKHISMVDADGVALAAIQGLNQKVEDRSLKTDERITQLKAENIELRRRLGELEQLFRSLAGQTKGGRQ